MRRNTRTALLLAGAAGCLITPPLMLASVHSPLRVVAALLLFGVAPGAALLPLVARRAGSADLALVVAASLAISAVSAEVMLALHAWSPESGTCLLAAACLTSIAAQLVALRPRRGHAEA
jgi:uncharacterized membrane protein YfcA